MEFNTITSGGTVTLQPENKESQKITPGAFNMKFNYMLI